MDNQHAVVRLRHFVADMRDYYAKLNHPLEVSRAMVNFFLQEFALSQIDDMLDELITAGLIIRHSNDLIHFSASFYLHPVAATLPSN